MYIYIYYISSLFSLYNQLHLMGLWLIGIEGNVLVSNTR